MRWNHQENETITTHLISDTEFLKLIELYEVQWLKTKDHLKSQETQLSSKNRKDYQHAHEIMTISSLSEEQESFVSRSL
jgi:hypothetical protein